MSLQRTHHTIASDGANLGATVHGQGPPLVFLGGVDSDGHLWWKEVLPHLTERFTCHLLHNRGRGLSGDHPDLSLRRKAQDVVEYVASLGEQVGLVGGSDGGNIALIAATRSNAVDAIIPFEPATYSRLGEQNDAPTVDDVAWLDDLSLPVLVVMGTDTRPFSVASTRLVADRAPKADLHEISGAEHVAALTHPEALAEAITRFFLIARRSGEQARTSTSN
jgi:pimeloyl-ACP methyl ester carboxylesterase